MKPATYTPRHIQILKLKFTKVIVPKYIMKRPYTKELQDKHALAPWAYYLGLFVINAFKR